MNRTPSENTKPVFLYAGTPTAAFESAELDCTGFDNGHATFILTAETGASAAVTAIKVQEAATTGGGLTDITDATFTNISTANDNASQFVSVQLRGAQKFLKVVGIGGGSNNSSISVVAVLAGPRDTALCDATWVAEV
jgi:hypothetical protein